MTPGIATPATAPVLPSQALVYDASRDANGPDMAAFPPKRDKASRCPELGTSTVFGCLTTHAATSMIYEFFARTDRGRVRNNNEDSVAFDRDAQIAGRTTRSCRARLR